MARKTAKQEAARIFEQFMLESVEQIHYEIRATRQPRRVLQLKNELDALEKVRDRFYNWKQDEEAA